MKNDFLSLLVAFTLIVVLMRTQVAESRVFSSHQQTIFNKVISSFPLSMKITKDSPAVSQNNESGSLSSSPAQIEIK